MKSILMIGLGRFGRHMALKLIEEGNEVLAIERDEERADELAPVIRNIEIGDATQEDFLRSLGVSNFDICVVGMADSFQTALEITVLLKDLGARYVVARATRDIYKKLLLRNGADHVVYAEREVAERLAVRYGVSSSVFDYIELTPEYGIYEVAHSRGEGQDALQHQHPGDQARQEAVPDAAPGLCVRRGRNDDGDGDA